jgi:response regulator of citrate/malate metabolism
MVKNLQFLLQKMGFHRVSIFEDARTALSRLEDEHVDLILVDQDMPIMSGLEFLHRARVVIPEVKIILVTACNDVQTISGAIESGANGYIIKPVSLSVLEKKLMAY